MSNYGLAADLHFHPWSAFSNTLPSGMNSRLQGLLDELKRLAQETAKTGGLYVVLAGDIFHVRGSVSPTVLNSVRDTLAECHREYRVNFIVLAGNHDLEGKDATRLGSAVTALECGHVDVVNRPMYLKNLRIALVPWIENVDELKETIEKLGTGSIFFRKDTDLILHAPIDGVIDGLPLHGLTPEYLAGLGYKRVFSGHYHNHKEMVHNVFSIGALAHHTWSDLKSRAGFVIVGDDSIEWRKSHLPEFIDVDHLVDLEEDELPFVVEGNFVRAKVEVKSATAVAELRAELLKMGAAGVLIQPIPSTTVAKEGRASSVSSGGSLEVSVGEYIAKTVDSAMQPEVLKAAIAILSNADTVET